MADTQIPTHQSSESAQSVTPSPSATRHLGLSHSDRWFLIVVAVLISGLCLHRLWIYSQSGFETIHLQTPESSEFTFTFDINQGTWVEWMQLEGVGETTARKIVADRDEHGPFLSIDDVQRIPGIGTVTLEKMRPHLRCDECGSD